MIQKESSHIWQLPNKKYEANIQNLKVYQSKRLTEMRKFCLVMSHISEDSTITKMPVRGFDGKKIHVPFWLMIHVASKFTLQVL